MIPSIFHTTGFLLLFFSVDCCDTLLYFLFVLLKFHCDDGVCVVNEVRNYYSSREVDGTLVLSRTNECLYFRIMVTNTNCSCSQSMTSTTDTLK
jgi:hypothetical protein